jgi:hypothetical protein
MEASKFVSKYCQGEKCGMCWGQEHKLVPATHKVQETLFDDDPLKERHELTQYVCDRHFRSIFGTPKQNA